MEQEPGQPNDEVSRDAASAKRIFTTGEAAAVCGLSQQTIIRCFDSGRIAGFKVPGSKFRRIPREELIRFMRANNIPLETLEANRKRILIVDDDPAILATYRDVLLRDGRFEVEVAANGYDAGLLTERFKPHLIILDYALPDLNGEQVCRRLRCNDHLSAIRVLCASGVADAAIIKALADAGADSFLRKPFDHHTLLEAIEALLGRSAQEMPGV